MTIREGMHVGLVVLGTLAGAGTMTLAQPATRPLEEAAQRDRATILEHIRGIFQAYLDQDIEKIRSTHSSDWVGFQGPSRRIERGLDDYMVNARKSLAEFRGVGFELLDTEVQLYGDLALVYYVARYDYVDGEGVRGSIGLRSLDVYRRQDGDWIQSGSHIASIPAEETWQPDH